MQIRPFALEHYFSRYEFAVPHVLCASDCEAYTLSELLAMADDECASRWQSLKFGYTDSQGLPLLRQEISLLYKNISADGVVLVTPEEGIFLAMHALLRSGDHIIAPLPGYQSLYEIARSIGCKVSFWQPRPEARWTFVVDELLDQIQPSTKLVVLNFPHNPTGAMLTADEFSMIVRECTERGIVVFSDEMYRYLEHDPNALLPSVVDVSGTGIALGGLSKAFGLPGLRIGWLASRQRDILERCLLLKNYTTICSSGPSEILALIALRSRQRIVSGIMEIIAENLATMGGFLEKTGKFLRWYPPQAGSVGFAALLSEEPAEEFCERLVRSKGVLLAPSSMFDFPGNYIRFGFGRKDFSMGLKLLEDFLLDGGERP